MHRTLFTIFLLLLLSISIYPQQGFARETKVTNPYLIGAIKEFRARDYGAAEASLLKAKESGIDSAVTLYYLGLTYKELLIYDKAVANLKEAAGDAAPVEDAYYDLAEIYFHLNRPSNALAQIERAEAAGVRPAYTAYLKGLILMSQERFNPAIKAFESARRKDPGLADSVQYQKNIAVNRLNENPE